MGLFDLVKNTVKLGVDVVSIPATIVDRAVVRPVSKAVEVVKEEVEDLLDD